LYFLYGWLADKFSREKNRKNMLFESNIYTIAEFEKNRRKKTFNIYIIIAWQLHKK
jgi:hypothetical protein